MSFTDTAKGIYGDFQIEVSGKNASIRKRLKVILVGEYIFLKKHDIIFWLICIRLIFMNNILDESMTFLYWTDIYDDT